MLVTGVWPRQRKVSRIPSPGAADAFITVGDGCGSR